MRITQILLVLFLVSLIFSCGEQGVNQGAGQVTIFLDRVFNKADLHAAYNLLAAIDKEIIDQYPGMKEFFMTKSTAQFTEDARCGFIFIKAMLPMPKEILTFQAGEPTINGDTMIVPVTFTHTEEDPTELIFTMVDADFDPENICDQDIPLAQKEQIIRGVVDKLRQAVSGKTFEMDQEQSDFILIREEGTWKISLHLSFDLYNQMK